MDLDNAVKLIETVCSGFRGTLQDHVNIQNAVKIVKAELYKKVEDKKTEE